MIAHPWSISSAQSSPLLKVHTWSSACGESSSLASSLSAVVPVGWISLGILCSSEVPSYFLYTIAPLPRASVGATCSSLGLGSLVAVECVTESYIVVFPLTAPRPPPLNLPDGRPGQWLLHMPDLTIQNIFENPPRRTLVLLVPCPSSTTYLSWYRHAIIRRGS